jgi:hypothetical protein
MLWASVPKASIKEHGEPGPWEHDIRAGLARTIYTYCEVLSESESPSVEDRTKSDLGLGVDPPIALHYG